MGIFYAAPLLGPSLGPLLGGILTQAFSWRAAFWLLAAILGIDIILFTFFFRDTFRCERSLTYRRALARRGRAIVFPRLEADAMSITVPVTTLAVVGATESKEEADLGDGPVSPSSGGAATGGDVQAEITLSLADVNPFPPLLLVLRRRNNVMTLIASGTSHLYPITPRSLTRTSHLRSALCLWILHRIHVFPNALRCIQLRRAQNRARPPLLRRREHTRQRARGAVVRPVAASADARKRWTSFSRGAVPISR
jgi:MFS family permease